MPNQEPIDGFGKFEGSLLHLASDIIGKRVTENKEKLDEIVRNHLFRLEGPTSLDTHLSARERAFFQIFYGFTEILGSIEELSDLEVYVKRFPYSGTRVTRPRFLKHLIGAYLNEVYVLKLRLDSYLNVIVKLYKKDGTVLEIEENIRPLRELVSTAFKDVVKVRGRHIHEARYTDPDLDRLTALELLTILDKLSTYQGVFTYKDVFDIEYRTIRRKWTKIIRDNNERIETLRKSFFDRLYGILADDNGNLWLPTR